MIDDILKFVICLIFFSMLYNIYLSNLIMKELKLILQLIWDKD